MIKPCWRLSPLVYARMLGPDAVFLDLASGNYLSVQGVRDVLQLNADDGSIAISDPELTTELLGAGLVEGLGQGYAPAQPIIAQPAPRRDLELACSVNKVRPMALDVLLILADAMLIYRRASLGALVRHVDRTRMPRLRTPPDDHALAARVRGFQQALAYVPFQDECLYRAFLLLMHLRRGGFDAHWVFGVRTWPFSAHCWLQAGDLVLNDTVDQLVAFTPILIV